MIDAATAVIYSVMSSFVQPLNDADDTRPSVLLIITGGTACMVPNEEGSLAPRAGYLASQIRAMPELNTSEDDAAAASGGGDGAAPATDRWSVGAPGTPGAPHSADMLSSTAPRLDIEEVSPLIDSSDMGPDEWVKIAQLVERRYYDYTGFVIVVGTDTMAYFASALSFMLENLGKPVVVTGAMIPFAVPWTDARRNIVSSVFVAATVEVPEVCIFFNETLLRGNRVTKIDNAGSVPYASPNFPPLGVFRMKRVRLEHRLLAPQPRGRFRVSTSMHCRIVVVALVPGFDDACLHAMLRAPPPPGTGAPGGARPPVDAVVLETYGVGNAPQRKTGLFDFVREAVAAGVVVVVCSQCLRGSVEFGAYACGSQLARLGAISCGNATVEAISTKLAYVLGKTAGRGLPYAEVCRLVQTPLRGEMGDAPRGGGGGGGGHEGGGGLFAAVSKL